MIEIIGYAGSHKVAMRMQDGVADEVYYLLSDHLGSTTMTTDINGNWVGEMRYTAWGKVRYASGQIPTDYTYTGQRSEVSNFGLMYYNARWYDSALGRFAEADSIIPEPGNPLAWDRFAYTINNPLFYTDPSGHSAQKPEELEDLLNILNRKFGITLTNGEGKWNIHKVQTILSYVRKMNSKLDGLFRKIFSGTTILLMINSSPDNYSSRVAGMKMKIWWGTTPSYAHICHEFGHIFDHVFGEKPTSFLNNSTVYDEDGSFVMGSRYVDGERVYDRQPGLGYSPKCSSTSVACSTEQHPIDWEKDGSGNNADEEWAELFMNYMTGGFDLGTTPGRKRLEWTSRMINWLISPPDYQTQ